MKISPPPARLFFAVLILFLAIGGAMAPAAGEVWQPLKTPTIYHACFSQVGRTLYASAVGSAANPGPDRVAHLKRQADVQEQYKAFLTERHGTYGVIQCDVYPSRAEATKWLADMKHMYSSVQWVDTGWKYSRGASSSAGSSAAHAETPAAAANPATGASADVAHKSGPFWACAASVNGTQYDSAIFAAPNLFPQQIFWEYRGWLSKKYNLGSMPNCESRPTHAEAEAFLARHAAGTIPGATSVATRRIATGWIPHQLGGPAIEEVAGRPPPAATKPQGPTAFYACKSFKQTENTEYTSAAFEAGTSKADEIGKAFNTHLTGMYGHEGDIECLQFASLAKANDWINQRRMFAIRNHSVIETTHWKYAGAIEGGASTAPPSPPPAPKPKPVTPSSAKLVAASAAPAKPPAATKGIFVTCNSNSFSDRARYYNLPIEVASGDYAAWQASFQKYLQSNFKYGTGVACNKAVTLAGAQSYFKEIYETAKLTTTDNLGRPWPVVITHWNFP